MKYTVLCTTVPGMFAQYQCEQEVFAEDEEQAIDMAWRKLKRGAFYDHSHSMWRFEVTSND